MCRDPWVQKYLTEQGPAIAVHRFDEKVFYSPMETLETVSPGQDAKYSVEQENCNEIIGNKYVCLVASPDSETNSPYSAPRNTVYTSSFFL